MIRAKRNVLQLGRPSLQEERDNESILRERWSCYSGATRAAPLRWYCAPDFASQSSGSATEHP
jgi:hypothetical protein